MFNRNKSQHHKCHILRMYNVLQNKMKRINLQQLIK
jgi:hypothetical protein